jgi:competence protein ComEA
VDPGRRAAVAVGLAVAVAGAITGVWVVSQRPHALAVAPSRSTIAGTTIPSSDPSGGSSARGAPPAAGSASPSASAPSAASPPVSGSGTATAMVVVDVAGKVHHPGVYRLPDGARVDDALRAAGGPLAGVSLDSLNLAAKLVDGEQVPVGVRPAAGGAGAGAAPPGAGGIPGSGASSSAASPVDVNTATLEQLETLPGVGPVLAQHILDWRDAHGSFTSVDQLQDVSGIGPAKFADLKGLVTL